jgi:hypothetical protein
MKIETKFDVGDKVVLLHNNRVVTARILGIQVIGEDMYEVIKTKGFNIMYRIQVYPSVVEPFMVEECRLFKTKQELIESL